MQCKSCGVTSQGKYDFCPNCGAYVKHQSEHALHIPKFDRKHPPARAEQPKAKTPDKSAPPSVTPPPSPANTPPPTTLAVRPPAQPMARPRAQPVRAKRRDPFATYAGAIIFIIVLLVLVKCVIGSGVAS